MSGNFSSCYRCGGKVEEDFLGRIRCTKCGYDFRTMSIDPDFEPEEDVCEYCNLIPSKDGIVKFGRDLDSWELISTGENHNVYYDKERGIYKVEFSSGEWCIFDEY